MATFLELVQRVARDSGTVSGGQPSTVSGQTGRLAKIVEWTRDAWLKIQNRHVAWLWMQDEFEIETISGTQRYTGAAIPRWGAWATTGHPGDEAFWLYRTSLGRADEGILRFLPWETFRGTQLRGAPQTGHPLYFSISPAQELVLSPIPDAAFTVTGPMRKSPQDLAANDDVPEMPTRHHLVIAALAQRLLAAHDEAGAMQLAWRAEWDTLLSDIERDQLPQIRITAEAIA